MDRNFLLIMLALFYGCNGILHGQGVKTVGTSENNNRIAFIINEFSRKQNVVDKALSFDLAKVEGSMYYQEDFIPGKVYYQGKALQIIPMRYNAYQDQIEVKRENKAVPEAILKDAKVSCQIDGNEKLVYTEFRDKNGNLEKGYLSDLFTGKNYGLYEKNSKVYKAGQIQKTSFHIPTPDKFVDRVEFYVSTKEEMPKFFSSSKKRVIEFFGQDKSRSVKDFIKRNKINLEDKSDVMSLLAYVDNLYGSS